MPKHDPSHRYRRLSLESLEDRRVLSGGFEATGYSPPPIIVRFEIAAPTFPLPMTSDSSAVPLSHVAAFWADRPSGFHHQPGVGDSPPGFSDFQVARQFPLAYSPRGMSVPAESSRSLLSESPSAPISNFAQIGSAPSGPLSPPPDMLVSLNAYLPRMIVRGGGEPGGGHDHGLQVELQSQPETISGSPGGNAPDSPVQFLQNPGDAAHGTSNAPSSSAGNPAGQVIQIGLPGAGMPVHVTAFLSPEVLPMAQATSLGRANEVPASQGIEAPVPGLRVASANLVRTGTSAAAISEPDPAGDAPPQAAVPLAGGERAESPLPHAADLIAEVMPFDRASLETAVDQFFDQLEDLGVGQWVETGPIEMLPLSLAVMGTVAAAETIRRRFRSKPAGGRITRRRDSLGSDDLMGFPELPGSWSTRLT
jgi:hypothetical protein